MAKQELDKCPEAQVYCRHQAIDIERWLVPTRMSHGHVDETGVIS